MAPYYRPPPNEDPKAWEDALAKKPGPGFIPVLCVGFAQMGERIKLQQRNLANFNARLHEINNSLSSMMQNHETGTSVRAMDARRKHVVLKQRCLALATKVQVLRNRGYAMGSDEEVLRTKLMALEKKMTDPGLDARSEEIWARMLLVQERARLLKSEIEKSGTETFDILDEEMSRRAKKVCCHVRDGEILLNLVDIGGLQHATASFEDGDRGHTKRFRRVGERARTGCTEGQGGAKE
jgi:nuclear pore complex protein Nup54